MATLRERPWLGTNFVVDLGAGEGPEEGFTAVVLPEGVLDVVEYRAGNDNLFSTRKLPGLTRYRNVLLTRGVLGSLSLYEWWDQARNGSRDVFRNVTIQLLSEDRSEVALTWKIVNAWPVRYHVSDLDADSSEAALETIELAYDRYVLE